MRSHRRAVAIEYSPDLMARVAAPRRRRKRWSIWTFAALALILVCGGLAFWSYTLLAAQKSPVITMAEGLAQGLISGDLYGTAETYLIPSMPLDDRRGELVRVSQSLAEGGINLAVARPVGYGGSLATVSGTPGRVVASVGWLYLESDGKVVGIELSARQAPDGDFRVSQIWKWAPIEGPIETHAQKAYEAFARESVDDQPQLIEEPRYIFERFVN